jgi:hypothetical protein
MSQDLEIDSGSCFFALEYLLQRFNKIAQGN